MRIVELEISNFRAIHSLSIKGLGQTVVIAGPNGCGKSSIFDALRLWKSSFGDYHADELQQWFQEFQLRVDQSGFDIGPLFRDRTKPIRIAATISLAPHEREFMRENSVRLLQTMRWKGQQPTRGPGQRRPRLASHFQAASAKDPEVARQNEALQQELNATHFSGEIVLDEAPGIRTSDSLVLRLLFSTYLPQSLGVIEYQPSQRSYAREQMGGVNLGREAEERASQHALYNAANKYQSLKQQLAESYLHELVAQKAGKAPRDKESLTESLQELFRLFLPDKKFIGLVPTQAGKFSFPVVTTAGIEHDINDLSSGEKEVLFGYLRLKNLAPAHSVLLLDEPELHLNPRLVRGLPQFYHRHLGAELDNQVWLLTHSDVLVGEAIGQPGISVHHMLSAGSVQADAYNQIRTVDVAQDVERLVIELVGEAAAFQPGRKVVIFEGGEDSEFDVRMTCDLFPEFRAAVNTISGTRRSRVHHLHAILDAARDKLHTTFYSIVDRDSDVIEQESPSRAMQWDAYHIENYLLEGEFVLEALNSALGHRSALTTAAQVDDALRRCAADTMNGLVKTELVRWIDGELRRTFRVGADERDPKLAPQLRASIDGSLARLQHVCAQDLGFEQLAAREESTRNRLRQALANNEWRKVFRGRDVLNRFVSTYGHSLFKYEVFRNLVLTCMRNAAYEPPGMRAVVHAILQDKGP